MGNKKILLLGVLVIMLLTSFQAQSFAQEALKPPKETKKKVVKKEKPKEKEKEKEPSLKITGFIDLVGSLRWGDAKKQLGKSSLDLYLFGLKFDGEYGKFGFHAQVNLTRPGKVGGLSVTRYFPDYDSPVWLEEGYVFAKLAEGGALDMKLKVGSIYRPFGLQGDNSWYFACHYYTGLSFNADYGTVLDTTYKFSDKFSLNVALAYFLVSDQQSGSRNGGFVLDPEGKINGKSWTEERDMFVGRVAGTFNLAPVNFILGGSLMKATVNETISMDPAKDSKEFNLEADLSIGIKLFEKENFIFLFGEYISAQRNINNVDFNGDGIVENWNFNQFLGGITLNILQDIKSAWIKNLNLHMHYSNISLHGPGSIKGPEMWLVGTTIGFTSQLSSTIEYMRGRNNRAIPYQYGNYFDEGVYIEFLYNF